MINKIALVTGGGGFTGSNLIKRLIADGWLIHAVVRPESNLRALKKSLDKIKIHIHDGTTSNMIGILNIAKPDIVFHLAALASAQHAADNLVSILESNIVFSTQLAEAMAENGIKKIVNTGTFWQHYENMEYAPTCLYAATKQAFEAILQYYVDAKSFKVITLKLFDSYGPNDPRRKLFTLLKEAVASKQPLLMSPGEQFVDMLYIDDVIEAFMLAADRLLEEKVEGHERYSVSSGQPIRLKELVHLYEKVANVRLFIKWGGKPYRDREVMLPWCNGVLLPDWKPKVSLLEGIKATISA